MTWLYQVHDHNRMLPGDEQLRHVIKASLFSDLDRHFVHIFPSMFFLRLKGSLLLQDKMLYNQERAWLNNYPLRTDPKKCYTPFQDEDQLWKDLFFYKHSPCLSSVYRAHFFLK